MNKFEIGIIGAGSWGTAIAHILATNNHKVMMWSRNSAVIEEINHFNENKTYLSGHTLSKNISATANFEDLKNCQYLFMVIPTQTISTFCTTHNIPKDVPIILCNKGIETSTLKFSSQIIKEHLKNEVFILSGPNFAKEIIDNLPAASILAGKESKTLHLIANLLNQRNFRCYTSNDMLGTEICGALKNVLAIACGICIGKNLGENAKAALITRGLNEIRYFIKEFGGDTDTLLNLSGIGDILLTCNSNLSRNLSYGISIAKNDINQVKTVEGVYTVRAIKTIADKYNVELPIFDTIYNIIYSSYNVDEAINNLLNRPI